MEQARLETVGRLAMTIDHVHPAAESAARLGRVSAVLNTASGSVNNDAAREMAALFAAAGLDPGRVACVAPEGLDRALDAAAGSSDVVVVLGGDGTIRAAAERCTERGAIMVPLPGGTMNMLPRALYGPRSWRQALAEVLAAPQERAVSGGKAGPHPFYVAALVGAPTLWADAREALRSWRLAEASKRAATALRRGFAEPLEYIFDGRTSGSAEAVAVMCPLVSRAMSETEKGLEAAAIDAHSAAEVLRLGINTLFNDWRDDPAVVRTTARRVRITGHGRVPLTLDGERVRLGRVVEIEFLPLAFRTLVPAESPTHGPAGPT